MLRTQLLYPFQDCGSTIFVPSSITLIPSLPKVGENLSIVIDGHTTKDLVSGNVNIDIKYEKIDLFSETIDLCSLTNCPIQNSFELKYNVNLPSFAPSGVYDLTLQFDDETKTQVGCITISANL